MFQLMVLTMKNTLFWSAGDQFELFFLAGTAVFHYYTLNYFDTRMGNLLQFKNVFFITLFDHNIGVLAGPVNNYI